MPIKGQKQPRLCRVCRETDELKFPPRSASLCKKCVTERYRETSRLASVKWRAAHPDKVKAIRETNITYNREYGWQLRDNLRFEVLSHYSPAEVLGCSWIDCDIHDVDMLVLDHIADDGAQQRRKLGGSAGRGWNFYRRLKKNGFPVGYQTLCCNHNHKKELTRARENRSF